MLTKKDISLVETTMETRFREVFVTKEEFITRFDAVMYELKAIREEIAVMSYQIARIHDILDNHETRITKLESATPLLE